MSMDKNPMGPAGPDPYANSAEGTTPVVQPVVTDPTIAPIPVLATGESVAERHLGVELGQARRQLMWTQVGSVCLSVLTLGYLGYLTTNMNRNLEPKAAAEVAQGIIQQQVETRTQELSSDLKQRIPKLIASFPDYAKEQLPQYRQRLEQQIDTDLNRYLTENSGQLDKMVDETLDENKDTIAAMLKDGKDPSVAHEIGNDLESKMMQQMNEISVGGESLQAKLDSSLVNLTDLEKRMAKLASNKNLTPSEKKARRAVALLASSIESKNPASLMNSVSFDRSMLPSLPTPASVSQAPDETAAAAVPTRTTVSKRPLSTHAL